MDNFGQIKKAFPELAENQRLKDMATDLDKFQALKNFSSSTAGEILIAKLRDACKASLDSLLARFKTASRDELIALISDFNSNFLLLAEIKAADENAKDLQQLLDREIKEITG